MGLLPRDLWVQMRPLEGVRTPSAIYDYLDINGAAIAQKVRYPDKTFRWRRQGPHSNAWTWNLEGVSPGLYRLPQLIEEPRVFLVEGEKAADRLWTIGLASTCGPTGCAQWLAEWSQSFAVTGCRELIILPDADRPGNSHAETVAAVTADVCGAGMTVKVLRLEGLQQGADVYDWLEAGHTAADLLAAAERVVPWFAGLKEQQRIERRRLLDRVRQQRWRTRRRTLKIVPADSVDVSHRRGAGNA